MVWRHRAGLVGRGAKAALAVLPKHWGKITAAAVLIMAWSPPTYRLAVDRLPSAYYKVASLGNPPRWDSLTAYNIDFDPVDTGSRATRITAFLGARDQFARLGTSDYIPGRGDPRIARIEAPGTNWEGSACLLVDEVLLRAVDRWASAKRDASGRISRDRGLVEYEFESVAVDPADTPLSAMTASEIAATYGTAQRYRDALNRALFKDSCIGPASPQLQQRLSAVADSPEPSDGRVKLCPRVEVWFYGSVAPCSLRPF